VIEIVSRIHRRLETTLGALSAAPDEAERCRLLNEVTAELAGHTVAEETDLYPAVRGNLPDGDVVVRELADDNATIERLIKGLHNVRVTDSGFTALVDRLIHGVRAHIHDEESRVFPRLAVPPDQRRPLTPRDPDANDQAAMWPDAWHGHRCR
jgi:hemerythrin superfamily protein